MSGSKLCLNMALPMSKKTSNQQFTLFVKTLIIQNVKLGINSRGGEGRGVRGGGGGMEHSGGERRGGKGEGRGGEHGGRGEGRSKQ